MNVYCDTTTIFMNKTIAIFIFFTLLLTMVGFSDVQLRDKKSKDDKSQVVRQKRDCVVKYSKMEFYGVYNDRSQIYFNANVGCAKVIPTSLSLTNMKLVDTKKSKWDQILAFREDKKAMKKLRNLRLFLHENYCLKHFLFQ